MDDDEVWEEEEILDNATHCPSCEEMTAHDILHEKKWRRCGFQGSLHRM